MARNDYIAICVESQKGGVGKTTVALNLARILLDSAGYEVLFLDLDLVGTQAELAAESHLWRKRVTPVSFPCTGKGERPERTMNLVDFFGYYMLGNAVPSVHWNAKVGRGEAKDDESGISLCQGKINVVSSFLPISGTYSGKKHHLFTFGPSVLFDTAHSQWFLDMVRALTREAFSRVPHQKLAVVIDSSPGFSGLRPGVEEWLTDLGPDRAKFLMVSTLDHQDVVASIRSIRHLESIYKAKKKGAVMLYGHQESGPSEKVIGDLRKSNDEKEPELSLMADRFFSRLAASHRDGFDQPVGSCEASCMDQRDEQTDDLSYYRPVSSDRWAKTVAGEGWWSVLYNRVPRLITDGTYEYSWDEVCKQFEGDDAATALAKRFSDLSGDAMVPYSDSFALQFVAGSLHRSAKKTSVSHRQFSGSTVGPGEFVLPPLSHDENAVVSGAGTILAHLEVADRVFLERVSSVWQDPDESSGEFRVHWGKYAPSWLFAGVLRSSPASTRTLNKIVDQAPDQRLGRAHEFLTEYSHPYVAEMLAALSMLHELAHYEFEQVLAPYIMCSLLAAVSLKQATWTGGTGMSDTERESQVRRATRILSMAFLVQENLPMGSMTAMGAAEYWKRLVRDQRSVRRAENELLAKYRHLLEGQRPRAGSLTEEFLSFCRGQLSLSSGAIDARIVDIAVWSLEHTPKGGAMGGAMHALIDRVLEDALSARALRHDTAIDYIEVLAPIGTRNDRDLVEVFYEQGSMDLFTKVLEPILGEGRWELR